MSGVVPSPVLACRSRLNSDYCSCPLEFDGYPYDLMMKFVGGWCLALTFHSDCCVVDVSVLGLERSPVISARGSAVPTSLPTISDVFSSAVVVGGGGGDSSGF